jgi:acyl-[acyl-carrier-protein]-phospholipid O-acyltransferase/long-chain-fatty-acid--[acyl-carrier-protein] ligase
LNAEVVFLDDFRTRVRLSDKLVAGLQAFAVPARWLAKQLGADRVQSRDLATIIFTSGSTGTPKGVMLSFGNLAHNVDAIEQVVHLVPSDILIGVLPYFHSFGYTITLWGVASLNIQGAYHFNPLEAQQVGKLCHKYAGTILLATPTFLRSYVKRCEKEQLATLDVVVCGAEKLPQDLSDAFEQKFGVRPVEGYGTTELSPLVSANVPPSRSADKTQVDLKEGTVGRPVPGVSVKVVDLENGKELGTNQSGMLLVTGPNVMQGYLKRDDLTTEVMRDGWYVTGDVALIDDDGFIQITGRESRFSKIGGEMVPHIRIEEVLNEVLAGEDDGRMQAAVTAVPDARKGERLVVLKLKSEQTPDQLRKALTDAGLPNLYIPSVDSFIEVPELPILGSGKLDLKQIKQMALAELGKE